MSTRWGGWFVILGLWSYAGPAAWPQDAGTRVLEQLEPVPAPVPASIRDELPRSSCAAHSARRPGKGCGWPDRIKRCLQYSYWGYADEFDEVPFGSTVRAHRQAQIGSGWAARLWLYRYDFCDEGVTLNPAGHRRLSELAGLFPVWSHHPVVIEATPGKPQLDNDRREHIAHLLEAGGIPAQVVVGVPTISAPFGDETREWNTLLMRQIQAGSGRAGGSAAGAATSVGSRRPPAD